MVLSGDGGLGKTRLAEALLNEVSPSGYWWAWGYAKGLRGQLHSRMLAMSCVPNIEVHGGVLESIVVCPWFLDNADDFREIDGLLQKPIDQLPSPPIDQTSKILVWSWELDVTVTLNQ